MKTSTISILGACILAIAFAIPQEAAAQAPEYSTWVVNEPTLVGETLIQPGTYRISLAPSANDRNLVRIMSADGQETITTVLTVPHYLEPGETMPTTMFAFYPAADGQPRALRTWFAGNPASGIGHDIVYDEERATMLARRVDGDVVTYRGTVAESDLDETDLYVVTPESRVETYTVPQTRVTTVETRQEPMIAESRSELPATAGRTPLLALLGLVALAGALALRAAR